MSKLAQLRTVISIARLEAYRVSPDDKDMDLLSRYAWNIGLSEALYPSLQNLEVSLRNSLNLAISQHIGNDQWFDIGASILQPQELQSVSAVKMKLKKRNQILEPGRIISELNFGFWTSLMDSRYEQILWPILLRRSFPRMPRNLRTRRNLSKRLNQIRRLRNRVFHHEPIWHARDLQARHLEILETIAWMSDSLCEFTQSIDRFQGVIAEGRASYSKQLFKE